LPAQEGAELETALVTEEIPIFPTASGTIIPSRNQKMTLLAGYDSLFDANFNECVDRPDDAEASTHVQTKDWAVEKQTTFVASRGQLLDELGFDGSLDIRSKLGGINGGANLVNSFSHDQLAINVLVKLSASYKVLYHARGGLALTNYQSCATRRRVVAAATPETAGEPEEASAVAPQLDAKTLLVDDDGRLREDGAKAFYAKCGTAPAIGLEKSAAFYILTTYYTTDEKKARDVKSALGGDGGSESTVEVKGGVNASVASKSVMKDVTSTTRIAWFGFQPLDAEADSGSAKRGMAAIRQAATAPSAPTPIGAEPAEGEDAPPAGPLAVSEELKAAVETISKDLVASAQLEKCHDSGGAEQCSDGSPARGYFQNKNTQMKTTGVLTAKYQSAANLQLTDGVDPFAKITERQLSVYNFARSYTVVKRSMEGIFYRDLKPFLEADKSVQGFFNVVAEKGKPLRTRREVEAHVNKWANRFRPLSDGHANGAGALVQQVDELIRDCWGNAENSLDHDCWNAIGGETVDPKSRQSIHNSSHWRRMEKPVGEYYDQARVARLAVKKGNAVTGDLAAYECQCPGCPLRDDGKPQFAPRDDGSIPGEAEVSADILRGEDNEDGEAELPIKPGEYRLALPHQLKYLEPAIQGLADDETWYQIRDHKMDEWVTAERKANAEFDPEKNFPLVASYEEEDAVLFCVSEGERRIEPLCVSSTDLFPKNDGTSVWDAELSQ